MATYLVRFVEIGRDAQVGKVRDDLGRVIRGEVTGARVEVAPGRLVVEAKSGSEAQLAKVHGVVSVSPCRRVGRAELTDAVVAVAREALERELGASFAVRVRYVGRRSGEKSPDVARALGDAVHLSTGAPVKLEAPEVEISVELWGEEAFVFDRTLEGIDRAGPSVPRAPGEPRFVADQMLGRLAARLRLLGYDTLTVFNIPDSEVTRLAAADGRVLLTQDGALSRIRSVPVHRVLARSPRDQVAEVLAAFDLTPNPARFFTRCTLCNASLERAPDVSHGPDARRCPSCGQIYWHGSHVDRFLAELR